jgi:hypothetical protein
MKYKIIIVKEIGKKIERGLIINEIKNNNTDIQNIAERGSILLSLLI